MKNNIDTINIRYSDLAETDCCLSCGGAADRGKAQQGEVCVDLGSGRGTDAIRMAQEVGNSGFVYGIDLSDGMIAKAEKTAKKLGISNVKFFQHELETLPIKNNFVDLIISNCVLNHVDNKLKVWAEIHRILKNGGRFVISDIYSEQTVPEEYKNDPEAVAECWAGASTKQDYLDTIKLAGFDNFEILEESKPYEKGKIKVSSFTITGKKATQKCSCC